MSDIDLSAAIEAGEVALRDDMHGLMPPGSYGWQRFAGLTIKAALPHIEAAVRERIARDIEADIVRADDGALNPFAMGQEYAARIARGESRA